MAAAAVRTTVSRMTWGQRSLSAGPRRTYSNRSPSSMDSTSGSPTRYSLPSRTTPRTMSTVWPAGAHLRRIDDPLGDRIPLVGGQQVFEDLDDAGRLRRDPQEPTRGLGGHDHRVRTRLFHHVGVLRLPDGRDDGGRLVHLACRQRGQHRGIVATGRDDDARGVRRTGQAQRRVGGIAAHGDQAIGLGDVERGLRRIDDDDLRRFSHRRRASRRPRSGLSCHSRRRLCGCAR